MAPAEPLQVALRVAAALERCGVRYLVGGSVASSVTGEPRSTMDVDLVVALTQEDVEPFLANLGDGFYSDEETLRGAIPIPYRVMVPETAGNLICPGRAVNCERPVPGPMRVQAPIMAMGQAAGTAAAAAIAGGCAPVWATTAPSSAGSSDAR